MRTFLDGATSTLGTLLPMLPTLIPRHVIRRISRKRHDPSTLANRACGQSWFSQLSSITSLMAAGALKIFMRDSISQFASSKPTDTLHKFRAESRTDSRPVVRSLIRDPCVSHFLRGSCPMR